MGGYSSIYHNDVWYSTDGVNWIMATEHANWPARNGFGCVVYDNKMWIIGGGNGTAYYNDVWYSEDGENWMQATASASWTGRRLFGCCIYNDKMWVIGGQKGSTVRINDVWYSSDGVTWTQATSSAAWTVRITKALIYNDKMWIIGGGNGTAYYNDIWFSSNGSDWTEANITMSIPFYGIKDCEVLNFGNYEGQTPEIPETPYSTMTYLNNFTTYSLLTNNCHFEDNNIDAYYDTDNTAYRSSLTFAELMRKPIPFLSAKNCEFIQTSFLNKFRFIWYSTLMSKKNADYTLNPVTLLFLQKLKIQELLIILNWKVLLQTSQIWLILLLFSKKLL